MRTYQTISADGHLEVPLDWSTRVPSKYKDKAPRLVRNRDGTEAWVMDEWTRDNIGNLYCGLHYDEYVPATAATYPGTPDGVGAFGAAADRLLIHPLQRPY